MPRSIDVYNGLDPNDLTRMLQVIESAVQRASATVDEEDEAGSPQVPEFEDLIGIDPEVYRQINDALAAGHRHLLFYGPPGTGKTTLAQRVAGVICDQWKLITGSSDWTSQDIIGGYHPLPNGGITFLPGVLLEHFDRPLIFDELNRCDIDKVIGPLFTVLSGQSTTLPYLIDPSGAGPPQAGGLPQPGSLPAGSPKPASPPRVEIRPEGLPDPPQAYAPSPQWRLIATINSIDKASLYQMSYALTRRFAWIYLDVPRDPRVFVRTYLARETGTEPPADGPVPLADVWAAVNEVRPIGPAPVLDIIKLIRARRPDFDFFKAVSLPAQADPYLDGYYVFLLPMMDGVLREQAETLGASLAAALSLGEDARAGQIKARTLRLSL